jgi:branched-chain amino acid transport system substrate-binding protein
VRFFMALRHGVLSACLYAAALCTASLATAQGVSSDTVVLGRTAGFTGAVAGAVNEQKAAVDAYFASVNAKGGVNGRKIVVKELDDKFDPKTAGENAKKLIDEGVFAIFLPRGTPHTEAVLKVSQPAGVPVIAPSTGAEIFHTPANRLLFNVRAKYQTETIEAIRHFSTLGQKRLALIHVDDSFGKDGVIGYEAGVKQYGAQSLFVGKFDRVKVDSAQHVPKLKELQPDAIIAIGSGNAVSALIKESRKQGVTGQFMTQSNNASAAFVKDLGEAGLGTIMTQVTPPAGSSISRMGIEYREIAEKAGATPSYAGMEGFAAAKVMVEGLRRAGRNLTRDSLIAGLESLKKFDLGGMDVTYGPNDRTGSTFVELSIIGKDGKFRR